jgi:hypothetical protein
VAEVPEVLAVVVNEEFGAGDEAAGGKLEEEEVDVVILVGGRVVRNAGDESAGVEGDEEVRVVDVMQGDHGAAVEEVTWWQRHEAEVLESDSIGGFGGGRETGRKDEADERQQKQQGSPELAAGMVERCEGNRHGVCFRTS